MVFVLNAISASELQIRNLPKTVNEGIRDARDREFMINHNLFLHLLSGRKPDLEF
jgi:hypothetical protein